MSSFSAARHPGSMATCLQPQEASHDPTRATGSIGELPITTSPPAAPTGQLQQCLSASGRRGVPSSNCLLQNAEADSNLLLYLPATHDD